MSTKDVDKSLRMAFKAAKHAGAEGAEEIFCSAMRAAFGTLLAEVGMQITQEALVTPVFPGEARNGKQEIPSELLAAYEELEKNAGAFYDETAPEAGSSIPYSAMPKHTAMMESLRAIGRVKRGEVR